MLALSLAFSCFTLTAAASGDYAIGDDTALIDGGFRIVGPSDVVISPVEDDGISVYSDDAGLTYKSSSLQYWPVSLTSTSSSFTSVSFPSDYSSAGFTDFSSAVVNGVGGYGSIEGLYVSDSLSWSSCTGYNFNYLLAKSFSLNSTWFLVDHSNSPSTYYISYLLSKLSEQPGSDVLSDPMSDYRTSAYNVAQVNVIHSVYLAVDIELPSMSRFDLSSLNWEFDIGTPAGDAIGFFVSSGVNANLKL